MTAQVCHTNKDEHDQLRKIGFKAGWIAMDESRKEEKKMSAGFTGN